MSRPTGVFKMTNEYADVLGYDLYAKMPKAVLAAIAVSFASLQVEGQGGESLDRDAIRAAMIEEWTILHSNGIIPQKPPKS